MGLNLDVHHVAFADDTQVRRPPDPAADPRRVRPDRRPRRTAHAQRHVRRHRRRRAVRRGAGRSARDATTSSRCACCSGATPISISPRSMRCARASTCRPSNKALTRVPVATDQHALEFLVAQRSRRRSPTGARPSSCSGSAARSPTIAASRRPSTARSSPGLFRPPQGTASSTPTGSPSRCASATIPPAISTRCQQPDPPGPHLDLRRQPQELACGPGPLARKDPGHRGPPERCPARAPHPALRRPAHQCSHPSSERPTNGEP